MDIKMKLLMSKFKNISYFKDLEDYISDRVNENKLNYEHLKYLYKNLYRGYSEFIKQNIYPVGEFLSEGHSIEECEKIAGLLEDVTGKAVFAYEPKEKGHKFNKFFSDLKFSYDVYDDAINNGMSKEESFEKVKEELEITPKHLRGIIVELQGRSFIFRANLELDEKYIVEEMDKLRKEFREITSQDKELEKHFENDNPKNRYQSIMVAGTILGGIDLRNLRRENGNLSGEKEEYPYNKEQIKLIDSYHKFERTLEDLERYAELNYSEFSNECCEEM